MPSTARKSVTKPSAKAASAKTPATRAPAAKAASAKTAAPAAKPKVQRTRVAPARAAAPKAAPHPRPSPAAPHTSPSVAAEKADKASKDDKSRKPKLVRDSFTIPKIEYAVLDALKARAAKAGAPHKKSELLRAGIKLLATLDDAALVAAMLSVPAIKTGRPANS